MLERAADVGAERSAAYGTPLTWLTREQAFGQSRGFVRHVTADHSRRSDPGKDFPAGLSFELIAARLAAPPTQQEDHMAALITADRHKMYASDATGAHYPDQPDLLAMQRTGTLPKKAQVVEQADLDVLIRRAQKLTGA